MSVLVAGPPHRGGPRVDRRALRTRARRILRELGQSEAEVSISLVDDPTIAELNETYRGRVGPTDVLSFSLLEGPHSEYRGALLGEVVVSLDTAARQARRRRRPLDDEVAHLVIHGVLHLLGYDHEEEDEAREMRGLERRLWRLVGS